MDHDVIRSTEGHEPMDGLEIDFDAELAGMREALASADRHLAVARAAIELREQAA